MAGASEAEVIEKLKEEANMDALRRASEFPAVGGKFRVLKTPSWNPTRTQSDSKDKQDPVSNWSGY